MQLLDRYLKSVASALPVGDKDDILRELGEDLRTQMEERETELGRPLTEAEQEAILKQKGHPLVVASRYRQDERSVSFGRQLIGPVLFPAYAKVLKFNLGLTSAVLVIIFAALIVAGQKATVADGMSALLYQVLIQFGVITLIFSAIQTHLDKHPDQWNAKNPAHFELSSKIYESAVKVAPHVSRFESITAIVASAVALVWFSAVGRNPYLILFGASAKLGLGPIWSQIYWPWVVLVFVGMLRALVNLVRPDWVRWRDVGRVALDSVGLGLLLVVTKAGDWVVLKDAGDASASDVSVVGTINLWIYYSLWIAAVAMAAVILGNLWRLIRRELEARPKAQTSAAER